MLGLRYFTMLCNDAEYKNMDQDESLSQLYDVNIWKKIFHKQSGWAYSFSTTVIEIFRLTGSRSNDLSARSAVRIDLRLEMSKKAEEWLKALHSCLFSRT